MKERTISDTLGSLRISEDVIQQITAAAALEVDGVADIARRPKTIRQTLMAPHSISRNIEIVLENDMATITVPILVAPGKRVPEVAQGVQENVKQAVQNMTGMTVAAVHVMVADLKLGI